MHAKLASPPPCNETGQFIMKEHCYTLLRSDGTQFWLEMDRVPMSLIDQPVRVEGSLYPQNLICVDLIAPA